MARLRLQGIHICVMEYAIRAHHVIKNVIATAGVVVLPTCRAISRVSSPGKGAYLTLVAPPPVVLGFLGYSDGTFRHENIVITARGIVQSACGTISQIGASGERK